MKDFRYVGLDIFNASSEYSEIFISVFFLSQLAYNSDFLYKFVDEKITYTPVRDKK